MLRYILEGAQNVIVQSNQAMGVIVNLQMDQRTNHIECPSNQKVLTNLRQVYLTSSFKIKRPFQIYNIFICKPIQELRLYSLCMSID